MQSSCCPLEVAKSQREGREKRADLYDYLVILESVLFFPEVHEKYAEIGKVYDYILQLPKCTKKKAHCGVTGSLKF